LITRVGVNISSTDGPEGELAEEILELANGCLCCSIKDRGVASIEKLMEKKGAFDHILLETTGLADPAPIAELFWRNEEYVTGIANQISLDGVICVVDAVYGSSVRHTSPYYLSMPSKGQKKSKSKQI
jgi:G3E family GTPase